MLQLIKKSLSSQLVGCRGFSSSRLSQAAASKEQLAALDKDGFFVVRGLVPGDKLDKFNNRFKEICAKKIRIPAMTVMKDVAIAKSEFLEGEKAITKIQDFCHDDELFEYCKLPEIVKYVAAVTGPNIMAMHTMLINKPPGFYNH